MYDTKITNAVRAEQSATSDENIANDTSDGSVAPLRSVTIEVQRWRDPQGKQWQARAFAKITNTLRTSGLLQAIPPDELKTLLGLLTFTTATGECRPTVVQVAHALGISEAKARRRLEHLSQFQWQGRSFITLLAGSDGVDVYLPALGVIVPPETTYLEQPPQPPTVPILRRNAPLASPKPPGIGSVITPPDMTEPTHTPPAENASSTESDVKSGMKSDIKVIADSIPTLRERIIAASRRKYTRPREEVEQIIAEQMGWQTVPETTDKQPASPLTPQPPTPQQQALRSRLAATGMDEDAVDSLLERFPPERIERQLNWLPHRDARNPAAFLIAAIDGDYEAPHALRDKFSRRDKFRAYPEQERAKATL